MKKVKILVSVLISMALLLALFVPATASSYQITVTGKAGETYTAYKVFSFYYTGTGTNAKGVYTATQTVKDILAGVSGVTFGEKYTDGGYVVTMTDTEATAKAVATKLSQNLNKLGAGTSSAIATGSTSVTLDVGTAGYYFVNTTMGTICNLTSTTPTAAISDKNTTVSVDKVIVESNSTTKNNSVQIGDSVNFKTTVTIPVGAKNVVLHDKMEAGFTFGGSVIVKKGNTTIAATNNYTFTKSGTDGCTFEIAFSESYLNSLTAAVSLTVEYSATLNENAEIASGNTNDNSTWATYGANQKTTVVTTKTSTYNFKLFKFTGDDVALAGAEFKLYTDSGDVSLVQESATSYRVAMSGETGSSIITSTDTDDGIINIRGLDGDKTYYLKETKAPNGYNMDNKKYSIKSTAEGDNVYAFGDQIDVKNSQGTLLPETGGTGTKILFAVGGVLVVVAFVLFTSKRRMSAEG